MLKFLFGLSSIRYIPKNFLRTLTGKMIKISFLNDQNLPSYDSLNFKKFLVFTGIKKIDIKCF